MDQQRRILARCVEDQVTKPELPLTELLPRELVQRIIKKRSDEIQGRCGEDKGCMHPIMNHPCPSCDVPKQSAGHCGECTKRPDAVKIVRPKTTVTGRSCINYQAVLAETVDITKPIVAIVIDHNNRIITLGNAK